MRPTHSFGNSAFIARASSERDCRFTHKIARLDKSSLVFWHAGAADQARDGRRASRRIVNVAMPSGRRFLTSCATTPDLGFEIGDHPIE
jgi:hypothetical protein